MTEEIKEKLDLFPENMNDIAKDAYYQLENYIINLQQENEKLKAINAEYERLNKEKGRNFKITTVETYNINELLSYKSRIDKAVEYIINNSLHNFVYDDEELYEIVSDYKAKKDLLNILQGSDEE